VHGSASHGRPRSCRLAERRATHRPLRASCLGEAGPTHRLPGITGWAPQPTWRQREPKGTVDQGATEP
jgi:hypothetical protein